MESSQAYILYVASRCWCTVLYSRFQYIRILLTDMQMRYKCSLFCFVYHCNDTRHWCIVLHQCLLDIQWNCFLSYQHSTHSLILILSVEEYILHNYEKTAESLLSLLCCSHSVQWIFQQADVCSVVRPRCSSWSWSLEWTMGSTA